MNRPALKSIESPKAEDRVEMPAGSTVRTGSRRKMWLLAIGGVVLVLVILAGIKALQIRAMISAGKNFAIPPESVTSAKVEQVKWQASRSAVGTLVAVHTVTVASELPGTVRELGFESGALLRRGDMMVKLDTSTEDAQLRSAQAEELLSKTNLDRTKRLRAQNAATPADLDAAEARYDQAVANVGQLKATIAKKTIRAPFDGRVSIRQVELGQVLAPGTAIATLTSITPIYCDFYLPQQVLADLHVGMQARLKTDVFPDQSWNGVVSVVNPEVDQATRNVRVRATFPNNDGKLRPGMFANVEVLSSDERTVLVIPATAVIYAPYGDSVYAVEHKDNQLVAHQQFVRVGERRGDLVQVVSGLNAGEEIVSTGAFKLHNGSTLVIHNELAPTFEESPNPTADR